MRSSASCITGFILKSLVIRMRKIFWRVACGIFSAVTACHGQGSFEITFDGAPLQPPRSVYGTQQYYESGMSFTPIGFSFGRAAGGIQQLPENGTTYLHAAFTQSLRFSSINGSLFSLVSVDLAEYSTVVPDAVTVHFIGYRPDGSIVTTDFTTDGIIDGTGPLADFQTFNFQGFTGLSRVEIPTFGWSLDNLIVNQIPEPTTGVLLIGSGFLLWLKQLAKRKTDDNR